MRVTLFPTYQEEHIHDRVRHQRKRDKKSKEFSHNLDQNIAVTENQTDRRYEDDGLLCKRMGLASRKAEQSYFQRIASV